MSLSPFDTFDHLKETICSYLETAYKIANPNVFAERADLLRRDRRGHGAPAVAQDPFIESTPAFPGTEYLSDILKRLPSIPSELVDLAGFGMPVRDFPLYSHQVEALVRALAEGKNLVVTSGTASGKTEIFLLVALAHILREAMAPASRWPSPNGAGAAGTYNSAQQRWIPSRVHERRIAAMRALILYPMNALVNDQLQRLRRILADRGSELWQQGALNNNVIHFGMYTGDSEPTGHWSNPNRQNRWANYLNAVSATWTGLSPEHQRRGTWPRPDGPEMICRWDMQMAPPDILVTNYSMLEYMLVRPLESQIFGLTQQWLRTCPGAQLTLVIDEAHTYTGARGAEIAHLIRRVKERLDIREGDGKVRCIATSASLPTGLSARAEITEFAASLFGEPVASFSPILAGAPPTLPNHNPTLSELAAFARFARSFSTSNPGPALEELAKRLGRGPLDTNKPIQVAAFEVFSGQEQIVSARTRTTRKAVQTQELSDTLWANLGNEEDRCLATAGVFSLGAFARPKDVPDAPPLISSRIHTMFRGIPGLWACMNSDCTEVTAPFRVGATGRPIGKVYTEPTPWCRCGSRILEIFTCRVCGLMFLGGIPDQVTGSLWPWTDDLESGRPDLSNFAIFGVEAPHPQAVAQRRSMRTTQLVSGTQPDSRPTFEVRGAIVNGVPTSFPYECPRCHNRRQTGGDGREIIEPLRTKGSKSFSTVVEDAFRLQPADPSSRTANAGRKSLTFADSRQDAAMLAGDLEVDHNRDLFRQIFYRILVGCRECLGFGTMPLPGSATRTCAACQGTGTAGGNPAPLAVDQLRDLTLRLAHRSRINPTLDDVPSYYQQLTPFFNPNQEEARRHINAFIRSEIAAPDFGLEPMGLAAWHTAFPPGAVDALPSLSEAETDDVIDATTRLLATEEILLPPSLDHLYWGDLVRQWDRNLLAAPGTPTSPNVLSFNPAGRGKLGRFFAAFADTLGQRNRLGNQTPDQWRTSLAQPLFAHLTNLGILTPDINQVGYGINIDRFQLEATGEDVYVCISCGYIGNRPALGLCLRCGQRTEARPVDTVRNFYKRTVGFSIPGTGYPDPFTLRVFEHSAQIEKPEARRLELRFQDVFLGNENPDDVRIDVLSVTTTMEMGVDIGSLLSVGLRNVPPTVANYQQRAGRAGRRGNGVASVLTYAQQRSHDQYYFADPPRIVSDPPRIPRIYLDNRVIAQRHVRALVLQRFFLQWPPTSTGINVRGVLNAWGNISAFNQNGGFQALESFIRSNQLPLAQRSGLIVGSVFQAEIPAWISAVAAEVRNLLQGRAGGDDVMAILLESGYLPRHAFPIDVVSLWTAPAPAGANYYERGVQRDLAIALSEFAPGAEVVRAKRIFQVVGLYDPYEYTPSYQPEGRFIECRDCRSVQVQNMAAIPPAHCGECQSHRLSIVPYLRPPGFCSEWSGPALGGRRYLGGGRERAGSGSPAQLVLGEYSFTSPHSRQPAFAPSLHILVRAGELYIINRGADPTNPGFRICPQCGRSLAPNETVHNFPADVPPHMGNSRGPRAGQRCPNGNPSATNLLLGHRFPSEVIQFGVDLPLSLDADFRAASGRAVWLSFGTLVLDAAARVLQINPEELRVNVRPVARPNGRVHGEVYLYDTLPGGAGYARDIDAQLDQVLQQALADSRVCSNASCPGACYSCLLDYQNQMYHGLLDRRLGRSVLDYLLNGTSPSLSSFESTAAADRLLPYVPDGWAVQTAVTVANNLFPIVLRNGNNEQLGVLPRHPLQASPDANAIQQFLVHGVECCSYTDFDLTRRPFWVINDIAQP